MSSFFKAYDMRGEFGVDFDLDIVYRIGRWLPIVLDVQRVLVGRDARLTSEAIRDALCRGAD
jgi:phosphomannomutase